ncbi:MAG: hypothetical protein KDA96_18150 [Planctomycetaceae bacterium]|nr:hypothetical protein [Planctomycetaceae bacterium]
MLRTTVLLLAVLVVLPGCKSIKSTLLLRDEMNLGWQTIESDGIPITLRVPTHLQVAIVDVQYAHRPGEKGWALLSDGDKPVTTVSVSHHFIVTEKIFTVDPKRPAAGDIDFTIDLAEDKQYLSKVTSDITDRTIQETSMAFERIFAAFNPGGAGGDADNKGTTDNPLAPIESVRAMQVFEIDDPCFEQNLSAFLNEHFGGACLPPGHAVFSSDIPLSAAVPAVPAATPNLSAARSYTGPARRIAVQSTDTTNRMSSSFSE